MAIDLFFSAADSSRVAQTFSNLKNHDISRWALTGGIAIELHMLECGRKPIVRQLHDIDFMTDSFASIPATLGSKLLLRHVHPHDPPSKNLFQGVDPETKVRLDVFRAYGREMERVTPIEVSWLAIPVVSLQDLVARHARLNWDLMEGKPVAPKYARDFLRLIDLVTTDEVESIWQEHRKPHHPERFAETAHRLRQVIASRSELLIPPVYSTNVNQLCPRCHGSGTFPLSDPRLFLSILGYC